MPSSLPDIHGVSLTSLQDYVREKGQPSFRADQVFRSLYYEHKTCFDQMRNLPAAFREQLAHDFSCDWPRLLQEVSAQDGTRKFLFQVGVKENIETVFIPTEKRGTACLSTQVGCKFACAFCASGLGGWQRHLSCAEIVHQVLSLQKCVRPKPVTHLVFMGMGEPLDNYDQVMAAVKIFNDPKGLHIAARRMTISTCGLIPQIERLASERIQIELAISLHAAQDSLRNQLMPINKKYPLKDLLACCRRYIQQTNRQITFEYILFQDLNSRLADAQNLAQLLHGLLCKVNLILCNPNEGLPFAPAHPKDVVAFQACLKRQGILSTLRLSRGRDICGACGQLRQVHRT